MRTIYEHIEDMRGNLITVLAENVGLRRTCTHRHRHRPQGLCLCASHRWQARDVASVSKHARHIDRRPRHIFTPPDAGNL